MRSQPHEEGTPRSSPAFAKQAGVCHYDGLPSPSLLLILTSNPRLQPRQLPLKARLVHPGHSITFSSHPSSLGTSSFTASVPALFQSPLICTARGTSATACRNKRSAWDCVYSFPSRKVKTNNTLPAEGSSYFSHFVRAQRRQSSSGGRSALNTRRIQHQRHWD